MRILVNWTLPIRSNHSATLLRHVYAGDERWVVVGLGVRSQTEGSHGSQLLCWYCLSLGPRPVSKHGSLGRRNPTWNQLHMKMLFFRLQRCRKVRQGKIFMGHAHGFSSKILDSVSIQHVLCCTSLEHLTFWRQCLSSFFLWSNLDLACAVSGLSISYF